MVVNMILKYRYPTHFSTEKFSSTHRNVRYIVFSMDTCIHFFEAQAARLGFWSSQAGKRFGVLGNVPGK